MPTTDLTVRPFTADELPTAYALLMLAFGDAPADEDIAAERAVFEPERSLATFDGETMVGCMGTYSFDMSVPGGTLPVAGTTWVGVSPTHRRRGVLSGMMRRHLTDVAQRGEPLAALWASEPAIYGRYGYGLGLERLKCTIAVDGDLRFEDTAPPPPDRVSLIPLADARPVIDPIYEACRRRRAGMHARPQAWWDFQALNSRSSALAGASSKYVAVAQIDGRDAAYAIYGIKGEFSDAGRPAGSLKVVEMAGVDAGAEAAMWHYLLRHDLVSEVVARRPVDESLPLLLTDSRRVVRVPGDTLHVRILDLPAALRGRSYAESAGVTIEVHDDRVEANDGTWRIEVAPEGVSVEPAEGSAPDLRMGVRALGSLYMGDISLRRLVAAGMVQVADPAAITAVDAAFAACEAGWAPEVW